jgi:dTDP-4-amino-4,6-dideoxygalactose transaminase
MFPELVSVSRALTPDPAVFSGWTDRIFGSRWFSNDGPAVRELEQALAQRLGAGFCVSFCNGTAALQAALRCLELEGEVLTTPFTFPATVHAIELSGLEPVFCDVDPETWNLDPRACAEQISERTTALLPVHVFGNPCDVDAFADLSGSRELALVYDAAHCFDVALGGRPIASFGDCSVLSFHASKLFHTGEGGAVLGEDPALGERLRHFRNFGILGEAEVRGVGFNGKLSELSAALGLALLQRVEGEICDRARLSGCYDDLLRDVGGLDFQRHVTGTRRNHSYFAIEIDPEAFGLTRDQVHSAMWAENIITRRYFFPLCSENEPYGQRPSASPGRLRNAHRLASRVLCLPMFGELGEQGVERCAQALLDLRAAAPQVREVVEARCV